MSRSRPKTPLAPHVLVLGCFTLSSALQHRQEAQLIESLHVAGIKAQAVTLLPGGFPRTDLRKANGADRAILFLRCFANAPRGARKWAARWGDWQRMARLVAGTRRSVILCDRPWRSRSGLLQGLAGLALKLRHPVRVRLRLNGPPPEGLLRLAGLPSMAIVGPDAAQKRLFLRLLRANPDGLPLTEAMVHRAMTDMPNSDLRVTLCELSRHAADLPRHLIRQTLDHLRVQPSDDAPQAIQPALEVEDDSPRLLRHLQQIKADHPLLKAYRTPPPQSTQSDRAAAFLQFLETGTCTRPGHAAWLTAPLAPEHSTLTRFEFLLALTLRLPVRSLTSFLSPWATEDWREQLHRYLPTSHPGLGKLSTDTPVLALHGDAQAETGLSQNLRMSLSALQDIGIPCAPAAALPGPAHRRLRRPVALYHMNADRIPQEMLTHYRFRDAYHIGFALWELNRLPQAHRLALDMLDEIWAPSVFVAQTYRRAFRGKVLLMRKGLPPVTAQPRRPRPGVTRFVMAFDEHSSVCRKNPLAALRAFQAAFGLRRDVELIIKTRPAPSDHWGDPEGQMRQIIRAAAIDRRVRLIREDWPMNGLLGLVRGAAALVSPHRAEGFGYLPAFALQMGVPVITTDWSGTRDFCTEDTAFPVPCDLVPVPAGQAIYPTPGAQWAEIDAAAMARTMLCVADDPASAQARAAHGATRMALDYSLEAQANRYADRLTALGLLHPEDGIDATALDEMFAKCS